jgi:hypothetical protein
MPILATMDLHRILQLGVFVRTPFTGTYSRPVNAGMQGIMPSATTLNSRSTRHEQGNRRPILAIVNMYRIL